jgi:hypothetical protein
MKKFLVALMCLGPLAICAQAPVGTSGGAPIEGSAVQSDGAVTRDLDLQDAYDVTNAVDIGYKTATGTIQELTPTGTTATIDCDAGLLPVIDLGSATGDVTVSTSNCTAGMYLEIRTIQAATARDVTWPGTWKWFYGGSAPTLSTGEDETDVFFCRIYSSDAVCGIVGQDAS